MLLDSAYTHRCICLLTLLIASSCFNASESFVLKTTSTIASSPADLYDFIATPENWPRIVASSHSVKKPSFSDNPINVPLNVGDCVEEVFGLPPLLPLSVVWECVKADASNGELEFFSKDGVPNFAKNCRMEFLISSVGSSMSDTSGSTYVQLIMEFEPVNPLVLAAVPLLSADNALALKVLLPSAMKKRS